MTSKEEPGLSATYTPEPEPEPTTETDMALEPKEFGLKKPSDFDGDRKKMKLFVLQCKAYLTVNAHVYTTYTSKIAFMLSFMNEAEAEQCREHYYLSLIDATLGTMVFPTFDKFITKFEKGFKATNRAREIGRAHV